MAALSIWLITRKNNVGWGEVQQSVVVAPSEEEAIRADPKIVDSWPAGTEYLTAKLLGTAVEDLVPGLILNDEQWQ